MIDKSYMDELKSKFVNAKTESERELVSAEMSAACLNDPKGVAEVMIMQIDETITEAKDMIVREKLASVLPAISMSYIAKKYFGKSRSWLCQRVNGPRSMGKEPRSQRRKRRHSSMH